MKKVYIPSEDELHKIEELTKSTAHTYKYILAKTIETLLMEKTLDDKKNILKIAYNQFREFPDMAYIICKMYPEEKYLCPEVTDSTVLCERLIRNISKQDDSIKQLDDILKYFEKGPGTVSNSRVISAIVSALATGLQSYPQYRYEYRENQMLDQIFECEMPDYQMPIRPTSDFITIEPSYALKNYCFEPSVENNKSRVLKECIDLYATRNGINAYDITGAGTSSIMGNNHTKKLVRYLEQHKRNYQ